MEVKDTPPVKIEAAGNENVWIWTDEWAQFTDGERCHSPRV